jgi:hypothetical protein
MIYEKLSEREIFMRLFPDIYRVMFKRNFFPVERKPTIKVIEFKDEDGYQYNVYFEWRVFTIINNQDYMEISNIIKDYNYKYKNAYTKPIFKRTDRYVCFSVTCKKMSQIFIDQFLEMMNGLL